MTVLYPDISRFPGTEPPEDDSTRDGGQSRMPPVRGPGPGPLGTFPPGPVNFGDCCLTLRGWPSGALDPSALPPEDA